MLFYGIIEDIEGARDCNSKKAVTVLTACPLISTIKDGEIKNGAINE